MEYANRQPFREQAGNFNSEEKTREGMTLLWQGNYRCGARAGIWLFNIRAKEAIEEAEIIVAINLHEFSKTFIKGTTS